MECVAGTIHRPGEPLETGWVLVDAGRVIEAGTGRPPRPPAAEGFVLPAPVNAHTHIGDRVARGIDFAGASLQDVVKPPHGLKHRILRETPRATLIEGMRAAIHEMEQAGASAFIDFREQGLEGVQMLREATTASTIRGIAMARCAADWDDAEANLIAQEADGIGLSALGDVSNDVPERAAAAAHRHGRRFALHLSEAQRDDVPRALDLDPDFLVHVCNHADDDLDRIAAAGTPIVLCPRSNALFGRAPDAPAMLARNIPLALGSDNAMFHPMDTLHDARHLHRAHPDIDPRAWLDAATVGGARLANDEPPTSWLRPGDPGALLVLAGKDLSAVYGSAPPRALLTLPGPTGRG